MYENLVALILNSSKLRRRVKEKIMSTFVGTMAANLHIMIDPSLFHQMRLMDGRRNYDDHKYFKK